MRPKEDANTTVHVASMPSSHDMETEGALLSDPVATGETLSEATGSPSAPAALPGAVDDATTMQEVTYATTAAPNLDAPSRAAEEGGATAATTLDESEWPTVQEANVAKDSSDTSKSFEAAVDSGAEPVVIPDTQTSAKAV
jgi:hypothetical protein